MKRVALIMALATAVLATAAGARELNGVKMADRTTVDGKQLTLNGMGLRTKLMFKVYVAGLYLENQTKDAKSVITSDQAKRVEMVMLRDLGKDKIVEAIVEGFEKNSKSQMPALKARLDKFTAAVPDLEKNDQLLISYVPGKGTTLSSKRGQTITIDGKDFADALFSVWLGQVPVDETLKSGMLGK